MSLDLTPVIGGIPYRLALAGGWIDQPFVSRLNTEPPGSMVVVAIEPTVRFMERCGMATGTRKVATRLWGDSIPDGEPWQLMRELYKAENENLADPSGSQDMAGLLFPGINRLDYDARHEDGYFPKHIETTRDPEIAAWLERNIHIIAVAPRPEGYSPLSIQNLNESCVTRLGKTGRDCFDAILRKDVQALGASFNACMECWEAMLPHVVRHPLVTTDLLGLLQRYQARYPGAMYSGCGGGYLYVASHEPVPGAFTIKVKTV